MTEPEPLGVNNVLLSFIWLGFWGGVSILIALGELATKKCFGKKTWFNGNVGKTGQRLSVKGVPDASKPLDNVSHGIGNPDVESRPYNEKI